MNESSDKVTNMIAWEKPVEFTYQALSFEKHHPLTDLDKPEEECDDAAKEKDKKSQKVRAKAQLSRQLTHPWSKGSL